VSEGLSDTGLKEDSFFVDSGLVFSGSSTTNISGLDHLEGETLSVLGDGAVLPDVTVNNGAVTLSIAVTKAQLGLPYTSRLKTLRANTPSDNQGTSQGKLKRVNKAFIRVINSLGMKVGPAPDKLDTVFFRSSADPMDSSPALFSGDKEVSFKTGHTTEGFVEVHQDQPIPLEILSIMSDLKVNG